MWAMGGTIAVSQDIGMPWQAPPAGQPAAPFNPLIGYFGTTDGRFIMFSMLQGFHYWPEVCERLGSTELIGDPRFDTNEMLMENAAVGAEIVARRDQEVHARRRSRRSSPACAASGRVVQDTIEIADDPQVVANGYLQRARVRRLPVQAGGDAGAVRRQPSVPASRPTSTSTATRSSPRMLGLDWDTVIDLKVKGVVA